MIKVVNNDPSPYSEIVAICINLAVVSTTAIYVMALWNDKFVYKLWDSVDRSIRRSHFHNLVAVGITVALYRKYGHQFHWSFTSAVLAYAGGLANSSNKEKQNYIIFAPYPFTCCW